MIFFLYVACGLVIGLIAGLIGVGGGAMLVPLFVYVFKYDIYRAVGTSLAVIAPVSLIGAYSHHLRGNVHIGPVLIIAVAAAVGIFVSGQVIHHVPEVALKRGFAIFLIFVAVKMLWK